MQFYFIFKQNQLNISADPFVPIGDLKTNKINLDRDDVLNQSASSSSTSIQSNSSLLFKVSFDSKIWKSISARGPRTTEKPVQRPFTSRRPNSNAFLPENSSFQVEILINSIIHIHIKDVQ